MAFTEQRKILRNILHKINNYFRFRYYHRHDYRPISVHPPLLQCESKQKSPLRLSAFLFIFHKGLKIFNRYFTHLLYVPMYARLQIVIQLSPTLTKLCHIKRDYQVHIICAIGANVQNAPKRVRSDVCVSRSLIALLIVVCGKSL